MKKVFAVIKDAYGTSTRLEFNHLHEAKRWAQQKYDTANGPVEIKVYRNRHFRGDTAPTDEAIAEWNKE